VGKPQGQTVGVWAWAGLCKQVLLVLALLHTVLSGEGLVPRLG